MLSGKPWTVSLTLIAIAAALIAIWLAVRPSPPGVVEDPLDFVWAQRLDALPPLDKPMTLDEAIAGLARANHVRIVLDWPALEAAGVSRKPHSISWGEFDGTLGPTIRVFVQSFSASPITTSLAPPVRFSLMADGGLFVTIDHDAKRTLRAYDVRDLLSDAYWGTLPDPAHADDFAKDREQALCSLVATRLHATEYSAGTVSDPVQCANGELFAAMSPTQHRRLRRVLAALRRLNRETTPGQFRLP